MLFDENATQNKRSSFLDSIGLSNLTHKTDSGTSFFAIEEAKIDLAEMTGNICSYFTYLGQHMLSELCLILLCTLWLPVGKATAGYVE